MAKIVKVKKKRSMRLQVFTLLFFSVSLVMYLCSSLFLRSINNSLSTQKQQIETQIAALKVENDAVKVAIQGLSNRERVVSIATDAGLSMNQSNIVTITKGE
ncbi:MAG: hypothetical protein PUF67_06865 [Firmicutes bacterium]|nr:hypothetical protein [Erysipelotrichaceae bacterium]MDD6525937.1 hypothetical protein [Bacillota bacterium]MDD7227415.1 hypothetical protein [Bacillota bacterium]MDY4972866.1 hypothetical protein [Erysipelotrichaceae bacterium]MDY5997960.1 hypothetical protein [Erysipelotrichaceae bacterium]